MRAQVLDNNMMWQGLFSNINWLDKVIPEYQNPVLVETQTIQSDPTGLMGLSKSAQNHHCWSETWCDKHIWSHNGNIWQKLDFSLRLQKRCRDWGHQGLHHHPQWTLCYSMSILDQLNGALPGILVPRLQSCTSFPQITRWGIHQAEISEWEYDTCSPQDRLKSERKRVHACTIKSLRFVSSEFHCRKIEVIPWKVRTNDFHKSVNA